jgi:ferredoxin-NADP reductase
MAIPGKKNDTERNGNDVKMRQSIEWQIANLKAIKQETPRVKTFVFSLPQWSRHQPGQHYDIRLTAPDGYQAQRSYSIASAPEKEGEVALTVERIEDGEVSTYLHDILRPGDQLEMRGPIGGYFIWDGNKDTPLFLVAGGSGVVPLMSMVRQRAATGNKVPMRLLYSSRTFEEIIFREELERLNAAQDGLVVAHALTRAVPAGWSGYARRIDQEMLAEALRPMGNSVQTFVCGPTLLVEAVADGLVKTGIEPERIRTERFGPTGEKKGA